ncbi:Fe-S cluster assembly protein HesB [Prosthecochloris sp. GSB1]|nr:Fe-S cluster assembly protein HesB [Prosthecochloris sp. GSB1]
MDGNEICEFQEKVFAFYRENGRRFPWRGTVDRYAVMVSETMLQQTQAERVAARFPEWMARFPDIVSLADASLKDVLGCWSGLGYNSRGQRLQRCARIVADVHGGVVPGSPGELIRLPGIGAYTSRSIPIFADNLDIATVDTNIRRILIHQFSLPESITQRALLDLAERLLPRGRSRDWHNALMDYGALVLTGKRTGVGPRTKQSAFKGSNRWYRGRIIRALVGTDGLFLDEVEVAYGRRGLDMLARLEEEGLVERVEASGREPFFRIPE